MKKILLVLVAVAAVVVLGIVGVHKLTVRK
jgi:hypothetical protein